VRALQYASFGKPPEVREVPKPTPKAGEVLLKVTGAGACHSDEFIMGLPPEQYTYGLPLTLGHEGAGIVAAIGIGAGGWGVKEGDSVVVYGPWGCGYCRSCSTGAENYCENAAALGITPPGLGSPGAMADYMIVPSPRLLVPLGDLDPVANVALTDAGLTPYHAIKPSLPKLVPGSTAVVIGVGGLGHVAIQMLRALSAARVVALDIGAGKLAFAKQVGAHDAFTSDVTAIERVRELTAGKGAEAVFDFVGIQPTADLAAKMVRFDSDIVMVGVGNGAVPVGIFTLPYETSVRAPYWGTRSELFEVLDLARSGAIRVEIERFELEEGPIAYERMRAGSLRGRAVIVP
jgi:alcohol dehydrogenase, propanol-preferring